MSQSPLPISNFELSELWAGHQGFLVYEVQGETEDIIGHVVSIGIPELPFVLPKKWAQNREYWLPRPPPPSGQGVALKLFPMTVAQSGQWLIDNSPTHGGTVAQQFAGPLEFMTAHTPEVYAIRIRVVGSGAAVLLDDPVIAWFTSDPGSSSSKAWAAQAWGNLFVGGEANHYLELTSTLMLPTGEVRSTKNVE